MKKKCIVSLALVCVLTFGLAGCGKSTEEIKNPSNTEDVQQESDTKIDSTEDQTADTEENTNSLGAGTILIYSQNHDVSGFDTTEVSLEEITPESILKEIAAEGVLPSDVTVLNFTKKEMDGVQVIDLDLSEKFGSYLKEMGSSAEYLTIGSICNTYLNAYNCAKLHITVNGEMLATGHAEYPGYMSRFS